MKGGGAEEGAEFDDGERTDGGDEVGEDGVCGTPAAGVGGGREEESGGFRGREVGVGGSVVEEAVEKGGEDAVVWDWICALGAEAEEVVRWR